MAQFSLPKSKKLTGKTRIQNIFSNGDSCIAYPIRTCFCVTEPTAEPVQILVSVSKRFFKRAVKRNRLKRLMRESYRLNQHILLDVCKEKNIGLEIAFLYISEKEVDYKTMEKAMLKVFRKVTTHINKES